MVTTPNLRDAGGRPSDVANAEQMRRLLSSLEPAERHLTALRNINVTYGGVLSVDASLHAMEVCRHLLANGVPCTHASCEAFAAYTFISLRWAAALQTETAELMRMYIHRGHFRMNNQVDAFGSGDGGHFGKGISALEAAIRLGNLPAAVVLVEEGERLDLRPSVGDGDAGNGPVDMLEMAERWWSPSGSSALLVEASMRRHISRDSQVTLEQALRPHARRAGL